MICRRIGHAVLRQTPLFLVSALIVACGSAQSVGNAQPSSSTSAQTQTAQLFAQHILDAAVVPPDARPTTTMASDLLKQPFESVMIPGLIDVYRLYTVSESPSAVESFVTSHLPDKASLVGTGTSGNPNGSATGFEISMPTSGPNENYAELIYELVGDGSKGCEFRVDAQVVWVPDRSPDEQSPVDGIVEVTGFEQVSLAQGSSGAVTIQLSPSQADDIRSIVNSLPLAPSPACMEDALLYKVVFRPSVLESPSFELDGYECVQTVIALKGGQTLSPLSDAKCRLLQIVVTFLPAGQATGTRGAASSCAQVN